jgi:hypothetical protein
MSSILDEDSPTSQLTRLGSSIVRTNKEIAMGVDITLLLLLDCLLAGEELLELLTMVFRRNYSVHQVNHVIYPPFQ